jgi:hypothetical protein
MGMPHNYCFLLLSLALLVISSYYEKPKQSKLCIVAFLFGLMVVIRPTNIAMVVPLLLFNIVSSHDIKIRFGKLTIKRLLVALPFFLAPLVPQLLYWKEMYGRWVVYSYEGESFSYWKNPKIISVLFDPLNGWLLYSPIVILVILGLLIGAGDKRTNALAIVITLPITTYIFASWWCWNFGKAFGHRCYIDFLPLYAFPIAMMIEKVLNTKNWYLKTMSIAFVGLTGYYSVTMALADDHESVTKQGDWSEWRHIVKRAILLKYI